MTSRVLSRSMKGAMVPGGPRRAGQAALEFMLIVAGFIVPMVILALMAQRYHRDCWRIISWFISQPSP